MDDWRSIGDLAVGVLLQVALKAMERAGRSHEGAHRLSAVELEGVTYRVIDSRGGETAVELGTASPLRGAQGQPPTQQPRDRLRVACSDESLAAPVPVRPAPNVRLSSELVHSALLLEIEQPKLNEFADNLCERHPALESDAPDGRKRVIVEADDYPSPIATLDLATEPNSQGFRLSTSRHGSALLASGRQESLPAVLVAESAVEGAGGGHGLRSLEDEFGEVFPGPLLLRPTLPLFRKVGADVRAPLPLLQKRRDERAFEQVEIEPVVLNEVARLRPQIGRRVSKLKHRRPRAQWLWNAGLSDGA